MTVLYIFYFTSISIFFAYNKDMFRLKYTAKNWYWLHSINPIASLSFFSFLSKRSLFFRTHIFLKPISILHTSSPFLQHIL